MRYAWRVLASRKRRPPRIQAYIQGLLEGDGCKMTITAPQVKYWARQIQALVKLVFHGANHGAKIGQIF
jgi:hypothetical protein